MRKNKKQRKREKKEKLKNKKLVKKYYWLAPRSWWTGELIKDYDYSFIEWGWSDGWDKAFGDMFMKELGAEIKRIKQKNFQIMQIKEKFGRAVCYTSGTSQEAQNIVDKYEALSENICYFCGRPDVHMTCAGWVLPMCKKCYEKVWRRGSELEYEEVIDDVNPRMADVYHYTQFSKDGNKTVTVDYSETTNEIRRWWNKNHPEDQVDLYVQPEQTS